MRNKIIIALVFLTVAIGGYYIFVALFESYEEEVDIGFSSEARRNPFLAAERFLQLGGVETISNETRLDFSLINTDTTVLITDTNSILSTPRKIDAALDWVNNGGFLVVSLDGNDDLEESIFQQVGIYTDIDAYNAGDDEFDNLAEQLKALSEEMEQESLKDKNEEKSYISKWNNPVSLSFEGISEPLVVHFPKNYYFYFDSDDENIYYWAGENDEYHLVQVAYGGGFITAITSSKIWESSQIGNDDNAYLLSILAGDSPVFYFFYNVRSGTLWTVLTRYATELLTALALLLLLWLWQRSIRSGRVLSAPLPQRRAFSDHIAAMGEFYLAKGKGQTLSVSLREGIFYEFKKRDPHFSEYDQAKKIKKIAELTKLETTTIAQWLDSFENAVWNDNTLIQQAKIANLIRKQL